MTFTMKFDNQVTGVISALDAAGNPWKGSTLTAPVFTSSDATIFTVAANASVPLGFVLTGVKVGTATLNLSATATEADGTTHPVTGSVTITLTPDFPPAASLTATFGTPGPIPAPAPNPGP